MVASTPGADHGNRPIAVSKLSNYTGAHRPAVMHALGFNGIEAALPYA